MYSIFSSKGGSFFPRVIKRELRLVLHLFQDKNLKGTNAEGVNVDTLLSWMGPMMNNYCGVFGLNNCRETGCGIDDVCKAGETCVDDEDSKPLKPTSLTSALTSVRYCSSY